MRSRMSLIASCVSLSLSIASPSIPAQAAKASTGHYLFAWTGDADLKGNDFLAVIDADPASPSYGQLITTLPTDQQTQLIHHTEYVMPASGMLFANDHDAGRTFIFDLRDPVHPKIASSFNDVAGYMHPHSYLRLPNGHVLVSFQHTHHAEAGSDATPSGGLVEIDDQGKFIRASNNYDPEFAGQLQMPYSLVVLPEIDRVLSTNSSMDYRDTAGTTYQIWRLSDLKLLKTERFDPGHDVFAHINPEEARRAPDGSVLVQTVACGLERVSDIATDHPTSELVHVFPGASCGVPTIVGHYLVQSAPGVHAVIALDITNPAKPIEVSRLDLQFYPHWTGWDAKTERLAVTGGPIGHDHQRLFLVKFDQTTGKLTLDTAFHDALGKPGFDLTDRKWPHGWTGTGEPHGVVFSR